MQIVSAFEAKTHFSSLLREVEKGEQVTITRHGRPIAKLVPAAAGIDKQRIKNTIQKIEAFSKSHKLGGLVWKKLRNKGRR